MYSSNTSIITGTCITIITSNTIITSIPSGALTGEIWNSVIICCFII